MAREDSGVKELDQLYTQARAGRALLEPVWILNQAYVRGDQWLAFNGRQLFQPTLRPGRITVVENYILPAVEKEIARMTKNRPVFTVTPSTSDDEDVNAAALGEQVMRYLWTHLHVGEIVIKALRWSRITGAGFVKVFWDKTIGDSTEVLVSSSNQVLKDAQGAPIYNNTPQADEAAQTAAQFGQEVHVKTVSRGDIVFEARSPFQMFPDPLADTFDDVEWVIEESIKSREYVRRRYNTDLVPDTPANPGMVEVMMGSFTSSSSSYKGVKLREYWARPSSRFPQGRRVVWAQGKILDEDDAPFDCLPYVMFSNIPVPGRLWPTSITEQLRGPQTELNKVLSQMAENRNRLGNPTLLANMQSVRDPERLADEVSIPGGISWIDTTYGAEAYPRYLEAPPLPEYVAEEPERVKGSIQDISGQHEVSQAQVPPGVTAASAITLLQEADDTRLGPAITDFENQLAKLGQKTIDLVANYYTDERVIRLAGENGAWQIFPFRGAMLKGNTHVEVQTGSAFPQSKAQKQAALTDLLRMIAQMGIQMDPKMLSQFLQDWEIGGADRLIDDLTKDETQVNRENTQLARGVPLPINDYDDDDQHIEWHESFQKSQSYDSLPPDVKQIFELHVGAHRERQQQAQQQQLEQQLAMSGQVPPTMTQAAFQDVQQLSQLQGQQQMQGTAQQQGFDQASAQQQQRQSEELHQHKLSQLQEERQRAAERHQQEMHQRDEAHRTQMSLKERQAQQSQKPDRRAA